MKDTGTIRPLRCPRRTADRPCYREITARLLSTSRDPRLPAESRTRLRTLARDIRANGFPSPCNSCTEQRIWARPPRPH